MRTHIPDGAIKVPVPDTNQRTCFSCGAAALHCICAYWGVALEHEYDYMKYLETDPDIGTLPSNLISLAKTLRLNVSEEYDFTLEELKEELDYGKPAICAIQAYGGYHSYKDKYNCGHYIVAIGYDAKNIYFEDPFLNGKRGYLSYKEFDNRWHDKDYFGNYYEHYCILIWKNKPYYVEKAEKIK